jgi:hypothetical protein
MDGGNEQEVVIKFCFKAGLPSTETLNLVKQSFVTFSSKKEKNFFVNAFVYPNNCDRNWNRDKPQDCEDVASVFIMFINTLRTGSFKLFKHLFPVFF